VNISVPTWQGEGLRFDPTDIRWSGQGSGLLRRGFPEPGPQVRYAISITGLSVAVAFLAGTIELVSVLHDNRRLG
jgi:hypothetical protein